MKKKPSAATSVAIVTGAGSGIGRAVALRLAREGWRIALIGRRASALAGTAALAAPSAAPPVPFACDITDRDAVEKTVADIIARFGRVDALINAAGTNIPRRSLAGLSLPDYESVIATNLHGALYCVLAVLPAMRRRKRGAIVNINSEAGLAASIRSGAPYVMAKFGLTGLAQCINLEERAHGIRACSIFPGDVDTPLVDLRPNPPTPEVRAKYLQPEDVAETAWLALSLPPRAVVEELLLRPA